ncbi:unnamed protein product [Mytilus coruscus]|uniref:Uncharacterized protein n=1 Tax=Mytilus coruscus TaxID=42192 RepID=A0A6J8BE04_MYTCO|nr:unnamed protein product [Mytilus coruscus]
MASAHTCNFANYGNSDCSANNTFIHLYNCNRDTSNHISSLQCSEKIPDKCLQFYVIPEALLILYRSGIFSIDHTTLQLKICQAHRDLLGIHWRRNKHSCCYPNHNEKSKAKPDRGTTPSLSKQYWLKTRQTIPVGSGLCKQCVTELRKDLCSVDINFEKEIEIFYQVQESSVDLKGIRTGCLTGGDLNELSSQFSQQSDYTQASSQDWIDAQLTSKERLNSAMKILSKDYEPLKHQLCLSWSSISKSSKSYYQKKAQAIFLILNIIAPGQETVLLNSIQTKKTEIDSTNKCIIEAYNKAANSRTQTQILSLIVNNFTKSELQNMIPGVTVSRVDAARKHAMIYRMKLTRPKIAHFIDYILNPLYSSIVGFGQTVLKLSTNEKLTIPKVVRNLIHARIINSYQTYCLETGFSSFSKASLYRILKVCNASKQKALQGLDNTSAAGMGAIDNLTKVVTKLEAYGLRHEDVNKLKEMLQLVNQFLKFEYKLHLRKNDQCADHCTPFAPSDSVDHNFATKCNHSHTQSCEKCKLVDSCVNIVEKAFSNLDIPKTLSDEISYELENGARNVLEWKRHLLRTVHQDGARNDVLSDLKDNQGLLIMDWGMKFLPFIYRETQSDFFGKKGISWHFSCLVLRSPIDREKLDLFCYVHILEDGSQGWFSIANILVHLLHEFKSEKPLLEELFLKSDNAACYHCTNLISFIQECNKDFPIKIKQYNFK